MAALDQPISGMKSTLLDDQGFTDGDFKMLKSNPALFLDIKTFPKIHVFRAAMTNNPIAPLKFVGSYESAKAYFGPKNIFLCKYKLPTTGYLMVLNNSTAAPEFHAFFKYIYTQIVKQDSIIQEAQRGEILRKFKNLHLLLTFCCGMGIPNKDGTINYYGENSSDDVFNLQTDFLTTDFSNPTPIVELFADKMKKVRATRISIAGLDKYIQLLLTELNRYLIIYSQRQIIGIVTSCRGVKEPLEGTNALMFNKDAIRVAVPCEMILFDRLVPVDFVRYTPGGSRSRKTKNKKHRKRRQRYTR